MYSKMVTAGIRKECRDKIHVSFVTYLIIDLIEDYSIEDNVNIVKHKARSAYDTRAKKLTKMELFDGVVSVLQLLYSIVCVFLLYYVTKVVHKPKLYCNKQSPWYSVLKENIKELKNDQWPLIWCYWPLWQAFYHTVIMRPMQIEYTRKEVFTADGGSFTLDFYGFERNAGVNEKSPIKPIVLILPGATGHSAKIYVREFIVVALKQSYRAVGLNFRGWGRGARLRTERLTCVTNSSEIEACLEYISSKHPDAPIMVVASSIGSCNFMNYLARKGQSIHPNLRCAMLLGVPWDPMESKYLLSTFWNNLIINKHMTGNLIKQLQRNIRVVSREINKHSIDLQKVYESKTVWDFDDRYICPMTGYKDHLEYYKDSALNLLPLENITIPVLALCPEDDPLCRGKAIPFNKILRNPLLAVVTTKYGGHLTWLEGLVPTQKRFPHRVFEQYTRLFFHDKEVEDT